jgi:hypothetical protein
MKWTIRIELTSDGNPPITYDIGTIARPIADLSPEQIGLTLEEGQQRNTSVQRANADSKNSEETASVPIDAANSEVLTHENEQKAPLRVNILVFDATPHQTICADEPSKCTNLLAMVLSGHNEKNREHDRHGRTRHASRK